MNITGSLIQAYTVCHRQAWLLARKITGERNNEFLEIGRIVSQETYKREKKEILFGHNKVDIIKKDNNTLTVIETKKSSKMIEAAKMQLLNYLYSFYKKGYTVKGEIRIPFEKKVIVIELGEEEKEKIKKLYEDIDKLLKMKKPPVPKKTGLCRNCSYNEFCWS